jgi:hypothetical protein
MSRYRIPVDELHDELKERLPRRYRDVFELAYGDRTGMPKCGVYEICDKLGIARMTVSSYRWEIWKYFSPFAVEHPEVYGTPPFDIYEPIYWMLSRGIFKLPFSDNIDVVLQDRGGWVYNRTVPWKCKKFFSIKDGYVEAVLYDRFFVCRIEALSRFL